MPGSTGSTEASVRCLTVFQDLTACPFDEEKPEENVKRLLGVIDQVANGSMGRPANELALEWRCVMPLHYGLSPSLAEQFVDLDISHISAGRKPEAVAQKIRSDIAHFVDSHSTGQDHAIVLAISDASQFAGSINRLCRAGMRCFVISASGAAPTQQSAKCRSLGCWDNVRTSVPAAGAGAASPKCAPQKVLSDASVLAAAALNAAITTPASPCILDLDDHSEAGVSKAVDAASWAWEPPTGLAQTHLAKAKAYPLPMVSRQKTSSANSETKGDCGGSWSPPARLWRRPQARQPRSGGARVHVAKVARGPAACSSEGPASHWTRISKKHPSLHCEEPAAGTETTAAAGSDTAPFDPYRIMFGTLQRLTETSFCIVDHNGAQRHPLEASELDFDYCWIEQLPISGGGAGAAAGAAPSSGDGQIVCCRLHKSGRITDIRMCGHVARIVRNEFGFIRHSLFPDNLYFRIADVDPTAGSTESISQGDIVAFRVGRKGQRKWAMRVWKTPDGAFEASNTAPAAATTTNNIVQKQKKRRGVGPPGLRRQNHASNRIAVSRRCVA